MEHPNVQLLRTVIEAFRRGDTQAARDLLTDDVVFHFPGRSVLAGDHVGKDGVRQFFAQVAELTGGTLSIEEHDILATDRHGVALHQLTANRAGTGKQLTWDQSNIYHLHEGKIAEAWLQPDDQRALDEFLS